jgi:hypothetical protein
LKPKSQNLKIATSQNRNIAKSQNRKIAKWQNSKMAKWQNGNLVLKLILCQQGSVGGRYLSTTVHLFLKTAFCS